MRIILLGNFRVDYTSENHHKKSLESLGHTVIGLQESEIRADTVYSLASSSDLFIWIHTHGWGTFGDMVYVLRKLKKIGIPTITYHLDLWLGVERQKDLEKDPFYKEIGWFFATDKLMADWFNANTNVKGRYLPAGVFDQECYYDPKTLKTEQVIFVGSREYHKEWPYRPQLIDWLRNTYGKGFTHVGRDGDTGVLRGKELNNIYAHSKVAVGDTLCLNFNYPYYISDRLFESTGRGAFTIFPYIKGIEDLFEIGKEIITYDYGNFDQLKEKIDYYLSHDKERETIRIAGHERTKRDHTYKVRWQSILKEIGL